MQVAVIPMYNSEKTIGGLVRTLKSFVDEVIVVDDGSTDSSSHYAHDAGATVLKHDCNHGYSSAVRTGFREAIRYNAQNIITIDSDGAHIPEDVPRILTLQKTANVELIIGSRFLEPNPTIPSLKRDANDFATSLINTILGLVLTDCASGLRCYRKDFARKMVNLEADRFGFVYEVIRIAINESAIIRECPIGVNYDASELNITKHSELLDFLKVVKKWVQSDELSIISNLMENVINFDLTGITLKEKSFWLHPSEEKQGWFIQKQHNPNPLIEPKNSLKYNNSKKQEVFSQIDVSGLHIGIIPDGTRRWARREGIPLVDAYHHSMAYLYEVINILFSSDARSVSVFLCSKNNLQSRPKNEVIAFTVAETKFCNNLLLHLVEQHNLQVVVVGDSSILSKDFRDSLEKLTLTRKSTVKSSALVRYVYLLVGYDPADELKFGISNLKVNNDLDLVIRTGDANVLSGFLPLQTANARLYFSTQLFNDFTFDELEQIVNHYRSRYIRHGE